MGKYILDMKDPFFPYWRFVPCLPDGRPDFANEKNLVTDDVALTDELIRLTEHQTGLGKAFIAIADNINDILNEIDEGKNLDSLSWYMVGFIKRN